MDKIRHTSPTLPRILLFDLGGVVFELGYEEAVRRFSALGLADARQHLDASVQTGIFGMLERGEIGKEEFRRRFSKLTGRDVSLAECAHAWLGYLKAVPPRNLEVLRSLRAHGYRLCLLSNTNPFMLDHVCTAAFDGHGGSLDDYFDRLYVSCAMRMMKPAPEVFHHVLVSEGATADEVLFIDDSASNTSAAAAIGLRTLTTEGAQEWIAPLSEMLGLALP